MVYRALGQDILQYQFNIKKLGMMVRNHAREAQNYVDQTNQLRVEIEEEKGLVERLRQQLAIEKDNVIRRHGYDIIAEKIMRLPAVEETRTSMLVLQEEINDIQRRQRDMDVLIEARKADIRSYLEAGQDLADMIQRDLE